MKIFICQILNLACLPWENLMYGMKKKDNPERINELKSWQPFRNCQFCLLNQRYLKESYKNYSYVWIFLISMIWGSHFEKKASVLKTAAIFKISSQSEFKNIKFCFLGIKHEECANISDKGKKRHNFKWQPY